MKTYLVGGAVRDQLLGLEPKDFDHIVVGSSISEMLNLGFKQVGADFPVFLHPETNEEYALARTERKTSSGYNGFEVYSDSSVTLEDDLLRRDLTINSIAYDKETNTYIDPLNGIQDLKNRVLRASTNAFNEDPLRLLRLARFKARYGPEWTIDEQTIKLATEISKSGELLSLTPERVWKETERALSENYPSEYFKVLCYFGFFPEIADLFNIPQRLDYHPEGNVGIHTMMVIDYAKSAYNNPLITFAALLHDFGKPYTWRYFGNAHGHELHGLELINSFCDKWKVPSKFRKYAYNASKLHTTIHGAISRGANRGIKTGTIYRIFSETDAIKHPEMLIAILNVCEADSKGRGHTEEEIKYYLNYNYQQKKYILECLDAILNLDLKLVVQNALANGKSGLQIKNIKDQACIRAIDKVKKAWEN